MPKLSVCIEMIFSDDPFMERISKVSKAGFSAFEFWGWDSKNIQAIKEEKDKYGLEVATFIVDTRGPLGDAGNQHNFLQGLRDSIKVAHELNCKTLLLCAGNELSNLTREQQHKNIVDNLKQSTKIVENEGVSLALEPLNVIVDHKGYYLYTSAEGFQILEEVGSPNIKLLYDIYHQQITEGHLIATIARNIDRIVHFHVADVPGRHEPGTGEINYANIFRTVDDLGYKGYFGLEFVPTKSPEETLTQVKKIAGLM